MIQFQNVNSNQFAYHKQKLLELYLNTFSKGVSAQHIPTEEAESYLEKLFKSGYGIFGFAEDRLVAALLATPPSFDPERTAYIKTHFTDHDTEYIAEVLVDENFRGQGLGKQLMTHFENQLKPTIKHIVLRVWKENAIAVHLYKTTGFQECGSISQTKYKPNTLEPYTMHKLYMLKSIKQTR